MLPVPKLNLGSIDAINYKRRQDKEFLARVFLRDSFLETVLEDKKYFLIGEKGTGKTAYAVLLTNTEYRNTLSSIRNLTETDYTKFVYLKENGHLRVSDYVDTWKVILLLLSAHHLVEREGPNVLQYVKFKNLKGAIDEYYRSAFAPEVVNALELVEHSEIAASLMTKHAKLGGKSKETEKISGEGFQTNLLFIQRQIEDSIRSLKLSRNHIVFIDGIDIRPPGISLERYLECIRGLAQAAWSLNTDFFANIKDTPGHIKLVLLLRPDILSRLGYQNTNAKVRDNGIVLDWRTTYRDFRSSRIFHLVDGILGKQQPDSGTMGLGAAWKYYFPYNLMNFSQGEMIDDPFIGFLRCSFYRPRDIVSYLLFMQDYVTHHENENRHFTQRSFENCQQQYSDYLLGEVKDHLSFYYSGADFDELTGFFKFLRGKGKFDWPTFENAYNRYRAAIGNKIITLPALTEGPEIFLQFLFSLNVIGYVEKTDLNDTFVHWCFRDRTPVTLNPTIPGGVTYHTHPGLTRALKVGNQPLI
ncbi:FunZ protein [Hypericibacter adhaerens]|uniref:FunZ protein n=1 Tax=Hypericibacter adhaerens TaxID=2602016 RepID=A0A5J6N6E3_9PROT|nr:funZ protein [Hypericibacter adhaerens]QEX22516.1 FunZ protein [Hypericibacter adhaerens]